MDDQDKKAPAERAESKDDAAKSIARFARYTSPMMLAMLASAGKDMAFAQTSNR